MLELSREEKSSILQILNTTSFRPSDFNLIQGIISKISQSIREDIDKVYQPQPMIPVSSNKPQKQ